MFGALGGEGGGVEEGSAIQNTATFWKLISNGNICSINFLRIYYFFFFCISKARIFFRKKKQQNKKKNKKKTKQ